jgi:hypothetical protein
MLSFDADYATKIVFIRRKSKLFVAVFASIGEVIRCTIVLAHHHTVSFAAA